MSATTQAISQHQGPRSASTVAMVRDTEPDETPLAPHARLERFEVLELLGEGGMGRVYRAHDPRLGRDVALKLLRRTAERDAEARLLREARAMARLNHPNLLPIFDVGRHPSGLFITMELVEGQTLAQWLRARARSLTEVLPVLIAAGEGLQAAHEAGLVHRDFKPSNVMIGDDGRVRVMDLGLARASGDGSASEESSVPRSHPSLEEPLTEAGAIAGSPPYMAPEQHRGEPVDARGDQYAFCVALWEALAGERPFGQRSYPQLVAAKHRGAPPLPRERDLPRWLDAPIQRSLAVEPSDRFPSMHALLDELRLGPALARRRRTLAMVAGITLVGSGAAYGLLHSAPEAPCGGAQAKLADTWDLEARQRVEAAVLATGVPHAADTWQRLEPQLDAYAARWADDYTAACTATHVDHTQSEALMDARMRCLDGDRRELSALVHALEEADARLVSRAVRAVEELPRLERCADAEWVQRQVPLPDDPEVRREIEPLQDELVRAGTLQGAGRVDEATTLAIHVRDRAEALGYEPLVAEAALRVGRLEGESGRFEAAKDSLGRAYFTAERWGQDEVQARAAIELVFVVGRQQQQHEAGLQWGKHAEALVLRLGDDELRAQLSTNLAAVLESQARHEEARKALEEALALRLGRQGPEHLDVALTLNNLGIVQYSLARYDAALASFERASAIQTRALGPRHPQAVSSLGNVGAAYEAMGRYDEALDHYRRSLAMQEQILGDHHPTIAVLSNNIGIVLEAQGDLDGALAHYQRALRIREQELGAQHPDTATSIDSVAGILQAQGHLDEAEAEQRRALAIREEVLGPRHPITAISLNNLGSTKRLQGKLDEARELIVRGLEIREEALGPEHPDVGRSEYQLGLVLADEGRHAEALRSYRRALAIWERELEPQHANLVECRASIAASEAALTAAATP